MTAGPTDLTPKQILSLFRAQFGKETEIVGLITKADISDAKKGNLHQEGTFLAKVVGVDTKPSKAGKPMVTAQLRSSGGKLKYYRTLTPTWSLLRDCKAFGIAEETVESWETIEDMADAFLGREVMIDVAHEQYEGNPTARIMAINPKPEPAIPPGPVGEQDAADETEEAF